MLLAELQANQRSSMAYRKSWGQLSVQRRTKEKHKWGDLLPFGYGLEFLSGNEFYNVLCVCKTWNK